MTVIVARGMHACRYRSSVACGETVAVGGERRSAKPDLGDDSPSGAGAGYFMYMSELSQGMDLVAQGRHQEAVQAMRRADRLSNHSNDAVLYNLGRVLGHIHGASRSTARPDEAIEALERCVTVNRYNARCWLYLCVAEVQVRISDVVGYFSHDGDPQLIFDTIVFAHRVFVVNYNAGREPTGRLHHLRASLGTTSTKCDRRRANR